MTNTETFTTFFFRDMGEIYDEAMKCNKNRFIIDSKVIPYSLKQSYFEFTNENDTSIPLEEQFNEWYSKQTI